GGSALLLADPESAAETELQRLSVAADVVLLPHHGSRTSSSPELVAAVSPRIGIASVGFGNRWGMPAPEVVARWRAAGTTVLTTADAGAVSIRFTAGAEGIAVETERGGNRRWWRRSAAG
ncbi:MAG: DNA internalization-related competence protein ComEC/Rec2, partial [Pseudomonadota bacterium]|nr:DNA internalization-related competence protein ComEC/Rec2 [Pseudomonadota bacterium]